MYDSLLNVTQGIEILVKYQVDYLYIDTMDGNFFPKISASN